MSNRLKYLMLPIAGGLAAFISFLLAAPYIKSLDRPWLKPSDPEYHFTFGTVWTNVQHFAFGFLLCGLFCLILETGRRTPRRVLISTILGAVIGGIANSIADSGSDYIGILCMKASGDSGQFMGAFAWFILVPASMSFTIALALGPTKQRIGRAIFSTIVAAVLTFIGRIISTIVAAGMMMSKIGNDVNALTSLTQPSNHRMSDSIPIWMTEAIVVGVALGLTTFIADRVSRKGSLRLVFGRNEFRDWSLDHQANRIGSGEVEIPVRGFKGIEPVHACIFNQGGQFVFDSQHAASLLNGYPVTQAVLSEGDTIQIGDASLVFYGGGAVRQGYRPTYQAPMMPHMPPPGMPPNGIPPGMTPMAPVGQMPMAQPGQPQPGYPPAGQAPMPQMAVSPVPLDAMAQPQIAPGPMQPMPYVPSVEPPRTVALLDLGGRPYPLQPGENRVGREVGNAICLSTNGTVSRNHAVIMVDPDQVVLTDVGSANGTWVNRVQVSGPTVLNSGDEVAFGSAVFKFDQR